MRGLVVPLLCLAALGCGDEPGAPITGELEVRVVALEDHPGDAVSAWSGGPLTLEPGARLTRADFTTAELKEMGSVWLVEVHLTGDGADRFSELGVGHVGRRIAFVVDGRVSNAPRITSTFGAQHAVAARGTRARVEPVYLALTR